VVHYVAVTGESNQQENAYIRGYSSNLHDAQYEVAESNGKNVSYVIVKQENTFTHHEKCSTWSLRIARLSP
jgi:hypothetical protein